MVVVVMTVNVLMMIWGHVAAAMMQRGCTCNYCSRQGGRGGRRRLLGDDEEELHEGYGVWGMGCGVWG